MISNTGTNFRTALIIVLASVLTIRIISLWFNNSELFFDEAQYWFWAQELEFGYFSKPPMLAWVIAGTTSVCGSDSAFCVRLAAPILHICTAVVIFLTARRLFDNQVGFWAAVFYVTLPAVSLSSTIISTDVPLLFFWSLALYAYVRLREGFRLEWVLLLGISIGLGLNSKYAMLYFVGCAMIHLLVETKEPVPSHKPGFWIAVTGGLLMLLPNFFWNLEYGFVTVSHTGENIGWAGFGPDWAGVGEFLGSQFGVFGPILFGIFLATGIRMCRDSISSEHRLLIAFSFPVLALILVQAIMSKAYANWAAATYIAASILVAEIMVNRIAKGWLKTSVTLHGIVFIGLAVAVCFAGPGQIVLPNGVQPFERTQGASLIAEEAGKILDEYEYQAIVTTDRKLSALMQYNLRDRKEPIFAWRSGDVPTDHFQLKAPFQGSGRDSVLVISRNDDIDSFNTGFNSSVSLGVRHIPAGEIRRIYFYRLEGHEEFQ